jgi:hypothetical protein
MLASILKSPRSQYGAFWASCHRRASDSAPCTRCKSVCSVFRKRDEGLHLDFRDTTTHMGPLVCLSSDAHTSNPDTPHGLADPVPNHGSQILIFVVVVCSIEPFPTCRSLLGCTGPTEWTALSTLYLKSGTLFCRLLIFSLTRTSKPFRICGLLPNQASLCSLSDLLWSASKPPARGRPRRVQLDAGELLPPNDQHVQCRHEHSDQAREGTAPGGGPVRGDADTGDRAGQDHLQCDDGCGVPGGDADDPGEERQVCLLVLFISSLSWFEVSFEAEIWDGVCEEQFELRGWTKFDTAP